MKREGATATTTATTTAATAAAVAVGCTYALLHSSSIAIPVLGSIIAGVPPFIVAFLVDGGPSALAVGVGYISINIFLGNFLEPMLMGRRFGLSTLVVIISVLFWGFIWGPVGMFLAVPLTMVLKVMLDNSDELRWIAVAITKEKPDSILDLHDLDGSLDGLSSGNRVDLSAVTADKRG